MPAQMHKALVADGVAPGESFEPAELFGRSSGDEAARGLVKAADFVQQSRGVEKGVVVLVFDFDGLVFGGDGVGA